MTNPLPGNLQTFIDDYMSQLLTGQPPINYVLWEKAVWSYFDQYFNSHSDIDDLFNRFADKWSLLYKGQEFSKATLFWQLPIKFAHEWEAQSNGKTVHKGTPYYFNGMSLIKNGNIDLGFLFFHQAVEEDIRDWGTTRQTPAWLFVVLDAGNTNQAAFQVVKEASDWLGVYLNAYQTNRGGTLTLAKLRNVLGQKNFDETSFSFTYTVFGMKDLLALPSQFRSSQFASQMELDRLFALARIAEVWLKDRQRNNCPGTTLAPQLKYFIDTQISALIQDEITELNKASFDSALTYLLNGDQGSLWRAYTPIEADLLILYVLRNEAGHAPTASGVVQSRFPDLVQRALFGLFTIADRLFP